jgi:hypothetical protein
MSTMPSLGPTDTNPEALHVASSETSGNDPEGSEPPQVGPTTIPSRPGTHSYIGFDQARSSALQGRYIPY